MKKYKIIIIVLAIALTITTWQLIRTSRSENFIYEKIDSQLALCLTSLHGNLFGEMHDSTNYYQLAEIKYNSSMCKTLVSLSSYDNNVELRNIMQALIDMAPPNATYQLLEDDAVIDEIGYCFMHLEQNELIIETWEYLQTKLIEI